MEINSGYSSSKLKKIEIFLLSFYFVALPIYYLIYKLFFNKNIYLEIIITIIAYFVALFCILCKGDLKFYTFIAQLISLSGGSIDLDIELKYKNIPARSLSALFRMELISELLRNKNVRLKYDHSDPFAIIFDLKTEHNSKVHIYVDDISEIESKPSMYIHFSHIEFPMRKKRAKINQIYKLLLKLEKNTRLKYCIEKEFHAQIDYNIATPLLSTGLISQAWRFHKPEKEETRKTIKYFDNFNFDLDFNEHSIELDFDLVTNKENISKIDEINLVKLFRKIMKII